MRDEATIERAELVERIVIGLAVAAGIVLRIWVLRTHLGHVDADEAVVGLMGQSMARGEWSTFYWGQVQGGSHEAILAAPLFKLFGSSALTLKAVPILLHAATAVLVWRIGLRVLDRRAARLAAAVFWVWPTAFIWWSTKTRGHYSPLLALGTACVLVGLRLADRDDEGNLLLRRQDVIGFGLLAGLAWWASPQSLGFVVPIGLWIAWRATKALKSMWLSGLAAVVGASPWIVENIRSGFASLGSPYPGIPDPTLDTKLTDFWNGELPMSLGLRVVYTREWIPSRTGALLLAGALVLAAVVAFRRRAALPYVLLAASYGLVLAAPITNPHEPRYLLFASPFVALVIGWAASRVTWEGVGAVGTLVLAAWVSVLGLQVMARATHGTFGAPDVLPPKHLHPLADALEARGATKVYAPYGLAYRLGFDSDQRITVSPSDGPARRPKYAVEVAGQPRPPYVLMKGSRTVEGFHQVLRSKGAGADCQEVAAIYLLCTPTIHITPSEFGMALS